MARPQLEKDVGGWVTAVFPLAVDALSGAVTIKRNSGGDLEDTAVSAAATAVEPYDFTVGGATTYAAGSRSISGLTLDANDLPKYGDALTLTATDSKRRQVVLVQESVYNTGDTRDSSLTLQTDLDFLVSPGDTLLANRLRYQLSAAQCPRNESYFRAVFSGTDRGERVVQEVLFDVGLRPSSNPATFRDIEAKWPDIQDAIGTDWPDPELSAQLSDGYRDTFDILEGMGLNANRFRDASHMVPLIVNRALYFSGMHGLVPSAWIADVPGWLSVLRSEWSELLQRVSSSPGIWYDDDDDGTHDDPDVGTIGRSRVTR